MKKSEKDDMGFLDHLEELRWVLVRATVSVLVVSVVAFIFSDFIFNHIILLPKSPNFFTNRVLCLLGHRLNSASLCINSSPLKIININMAGQFNTHIMVSVYVGFIVAFPFVALQFWQFVKPALNDIERRRTRGAVFYISALFILGVLFGYYIISPLTIHFFGSYSVSQEVTNQINIGSYIGSVASVTLATGLLFELPILIVFLTKAGIVTPQFLKKYRKHTFILIMVVAAIITPPDVLSLLLVCVPLWLLFEVSIVISARLYRRNLKA
ncbi:MAG: twin-arginine translocase subunit TatC [Bacteroidales bacterium]|nr:twin-arginine translocase subunit TatC [Tenuifilaceae bacterium]